MGQPITAPGWSSGYQDTCRQRARKGLTVLPASPSPIPLSSAPKGKALTPEVSSSLLLPSCPELPSPAEHFYQYPDGPGPYTRASCTGSHRGLPWQTFIGLDGPCCSPSCPGAAFPGQLLDSPLLLEALAVPFPEAQAGPKSLPTSPQPGRAEFWSLLYQRLMLWPGGLLLPLWASVFQPAKWGWGSLNQKKIPRS